jgi:hypothetical protein
MRRRSVPAVLTELRRLEPKGTTKSYAPMTGEPGSSWRSKAQDAHTLGLDVPTLLARTDGVIE